MLAHSMITCMHCITGPLLLLLSIGEGEDLAHVEEAMIGAISRR